MNRIVIADAVLQGVKIAQAARDLGVFRSWASREAYQPETQRLITSLKKQDPANRCLSTSPCAEHHR